jgi:hypothetical protein
MLLFYPFVAFGVDSVIQMLIENIRENLAGLESRPSIRGVSLRDEQKRTICLLHNSDMRTNMTDRATSVSLYSSKK